MCLQRAQDPARPVYEATNFQRQAEQLRDYYRACRCRLQELDGEDSDSSHSSSASSDPVTVTHHLDVTTTRLGDGGLEVSSQECVLPPVVDSVSDLELTYSSDLPFEDLPSSGGTVCSQLDISVLTVSGNFTSPRVGSSHHSSVGGQEEEE